MKMFMNLCNVYEILSQLYYLYVISRGLSELNEFTTFVIGLFFFGLLGGRGREGKKTSVSPLCQGSRFRKHFPKRYMSIDVTLK
jgi:hypothetical protein